MIAVRQQAGQIPLSLPVLLVLIISPFLFVDVINGQPNYYFKASAPAVKSLPRIGRRSEDNGGGDSGVLPTPGGGGLSQNSPVSLARSFDISNPGILDMWGRESSQDGPFQNGNLIRASNPSSSSGTSSYIAPISPILAASQLDKSLFWRKLLGDINNYEEALLENMYRS